HVAARTRIYTLSLHDALPILLRADQPRRLQGRPQELEHFSLEVEAASQRVLMDYYVIRQAQGGAVLAARMLPNDLAACGRPAPRSEEHTSELQSRFDLVCRLL